MWGEGRRIRRLLLQQRKSPRQEQGYRRRMPLSKSLAEPGSWRGYPPLRDPGGTALPRRRRRKRWRRCSCPCSCCLPGSGEASAKPARGGSKRLSRVREQADSVHSVVGGCTVRGGSHGQGSDEAYRGIGGVVRKGRAENISPHVVQLAHACVRACRGQRQDLHGGISSRGSSEWESEPAWLKGENSRSRQHCCSSGMRQTRPSPSQQSSLFATQSSMCPTCRISSCSLCKSSA